MTKEIFLMGLLTSGWSWGPSESPKYMALRKGTFSWFIDPFTLDLGKLIEMSQHEAYHRGYLDAAQNKEKDFYREET